MPPDPQCWGESGSTPEACPDQSGNWANTFQTLVFMALGGVTFFVIVNKMGGLSNALIQVNADLLIRGDHINPLNMLTYTFIPLSVGMFPHIFMHWLTAKRAETFHYPIIFYPICVAILGVTYILSLVSNRSIFKLAIWSFTGFTSLFPIVVAALFWRRSTKYGALASVFSVVVLWSYFFFKGWQTPGYTVGGTGIMPVAVIFAVSAVAMIIASLLTKPPDSAVVDKFFQTCS